MIIITIDHGNFNVRRDTDNPEHVFKIQPNGTLIGYKGKPIKNYPKGFSKQNILTSLTLLSEEYLSEHQKGLLFAILNSDLNENQYQILERMTNAGCYNFLISKSDIISDDILNHFKKWLKLARKYEEEHPNSKYNLNCLKTYEKTLIFREDAAVQSLLNYYPEWIIKQFHNHFYETRYWNKVSKWLFDDSIFNYFNVINNYHYECSTIIRLFDELISCAELFNIKLENKKPLKQLFELRKIVENKENEIIDITLKKNQKEEWEFEDDNFEVIVPTTYDELIKESEQQHNCVGDYWTRNYGNSLKKGIQKRGVVFIRKKDNPTKSYITCDFTLNNYSICQYLKSCNVPADEKIEKEFRIKFQQHLNSLL